ncbi:hypothetical protein B0H34DRAFT_413994 [Crassisporium funariophilum]|nr:hypothetical protein B0H34DRAFT_413994 [Crassisporium funariophilum]
MQQMATMICRIGVVEKLCVSSCCRIASLRCIVAEQQLLSGRLPKLHLPKAIWSCRMRIYGCWIRRQNTPRGEGSQHHLISQNHSHQYFVLAQSPEARRPLCRRSFYQIVFEICIFETLCCDSMLPEKLTITPVYGLRSGMRRTTLPSSFHHSQGLLYLLVNEHGVGLACLFLSLCVTLQGF